MNLLSESEFSAVFAAPMQSVALDTPLPFDFWPYFGAIPSDDFEGRDCSEGRVSNAWNDATGRYQHVLVDSDNKNTFMVVVLDLQEGTVLGHRLLNLNREYGLETL